MSLLKHVIVYSSKEEFLVTDQRLQEMGTFSCSFDSPSSLANGTDPLRAQTPASQGSIVYFDAALAPLGTPCGSTLQFNNDRAAVMCYAHSGDSQRAGLGHFFELGTRPVEDQPDCTDAAALHLEHFSPQQFNSLPLTSPRPSQNEIFEPKGEYTEQGHLEPNLKSDETPACWEHGCDGRVFSSWSNLRRHQREKSRDTPECFCPRCGAFFSRTTARNQHLANQSCTRIRRYSNGRVRPSLLRIHEKMEVELEGETLELGPET